MKRVSFESVSKRLFRHAQAPRVRRCPDQNVMGRCGRSAPPHGGIFRTVRGSFTPRGALDTGYGFHFLFELAVRSALARCRKMFQDCVRFQYAPARQNNARRVGSFFRISGGIFHDAGFIRCTFRRRSVSARAAAVHAAALVLEAVHQHALRRGPARPCQFTRAPDRALYRGHRARGLHRRLFRPARLCSRRADAAVSVSRAGAASRPTAAAAGAASRRIHAF